MKVTLGNKGGRITRSLAAKATAIPVAEVIEALALPEEEPVADATPAERWEKLIEEELGDEEPEAPPIVAAAVPESPSPLEQAFAMMGKLVEATANRPQPPAPVVHVHTGDNDPEQAFSTMRSMVEAFAARPDPPAPSVTVQPAAAPDVHVHQGEISLNVPEQKPPDVHVNFDVPVQEPPNIAVHVPEQRVPDVHVQVEAPNVHVAAQEAPKPPDVFVTVEAPTPPRPASVRLEIDEDGTRRFITEDEEEETE